MNTDVMETSVATLTERAPDGWFKRWASRPSCTPNNLTWWLFYVVLWFVPNFWIGLVTLLTVCISGQFYVWRRVSLETQYANLFKQIRQTTMMASDKQIDQFIERAKLARTQEENK